MTHHAANPTTASLWRRAAVRPVLRAYVEHEDVDVVMLSGSTARGEADRWSDVEVGVFWSSIPSLADREAAAMAGDACDLRAVTSQGDGPPWYDHIYLGARRPAGLMVEVVHSLTSVTEEMIDSTLRRFDPQPGALDAIKGIVDGREVAGVHAHLLTRWQAAADPYPRDLQIAIIQRYGWIEQFWRWRMLHDRDNPVLLSRELFRVTNQMLMVLHALNGVYCGHPSAFKRLDMMERDLPLAPVALGSRLRTIFTNPTQDGAVALHDLVEETYDLIEQHLPEVDVDLLRSQFRSERAPLEALPDRPASPTWP